jgi:hypothetical protein
MSSKQRAVYFGCGRRFLDATESDGEFLKTHAKRLAALLCFSMFFVVCSCGQGAEPSASTESGDPPSRVARLSYMQGAVSFEPAGENDWSQATLNYPLTTGDRLWTDANARAELETGNVAIRMWQQTDLTTTSLTDQLMQFGLAQGSLRVSVYDLRPGNSIEVDTPSAAITIVQAGYYRVDVYPDQNITLLTVNSGEAQVTGNDLNQAVDSGQAASLTGSNPAQLQWVQQPGNDDFDQWSSERDQKYLKAQARQYVSPEVPGYYDLDGYGSWATVAQYGPVWYPASVPAGWCPYRYGRWVWVEPWGWTWVEDEPWGFAPFHYGRWVQVGPRWGWLPGPVAVAPIYGPAFVAFVGGPSFSVAFGAGGVAAWFPLGPGEPFYPWYHYGPTYLQRINVTNVRNINITNINVTNINNVHYRYQSTATTAVSENAFRNAEPVMRNQVKVSPQDLAKAQVIPHPQINPEARALAAGANATHPPVSAQRPEIVQHPPVEESEVGSRGLRRPPAAPARPNPSRPLPPAPRPTEPARQNPYEARTQPPSSPPPQTARQYSPPAPANPPQQTSRPPAGNSNASGNSSASQNASSGGRSQGNNQSNGGQGSNQQGNNQSGQQQGNNVASGAQGAGKSNENQSSQANRPENAAPPSRPSLVARTAPPPGKLSYQQTAPAMAQHPGRPLEPQQRQNIYAGKPAGPMQDREFPPHAGPVRPQSAPSSSSHGASPRH